jgi:hypothetical protein
MNKWLTNAQRAIRAFLKVRTTYDVLPLSYRLIVLDTALLVRKSLNILIQCGKSSMRLQLPSWTSTDMHQELYQLPCGIARLPPMPASSQPPTTSMWYNTTGRTLMLSPRLTSSN